MLLTQCVLQFCNSVIPLVDINSAQEDVEEAMRLMAACKASMVSDDTDAAGEDPTARIFAIVRDYCVERAAADVRARARSGAAAAAMFVGARRRP